MIRKFINSKLILIDLEQIEDVELDNKMFLVIQTERVNEKYILVEKIERENLCDLIQLTSVISTQKQNTQNEDFDEKLEEYRSVILNKDPFGKYSGVSLGEIFDKKDITWIMQCVNNMKNEFIRERVAYLEHYYKL